MCNVIKTPITICNVIETKITICNVIKTTITICNVVGTTITICNVIETLITICNSQRRVTSPESSCSLWSSTGGETHSRKYPSISSGLFESHSDMNRSRVNVVHEIIRAEGDYVKQLNDVVQVSIRPVIRIPPLI